MLIHIALVVDAAHFAVPEVEEQRSRGTFADRGKDAGARRRAEVVSEKESRRSSGMSSRSSLPRSALQAVVNTFASSNSSISRILRLHV